MTVMTWSMLRDLDRLLQILKTNMFTLSQIVCTVFYNFIFQTGMMWAAWALTIVHLNAPAPEQLWDVVTPSWRRYPRVFQPRHLNSTLMSTRSDPSTLRDWSIWNLWQDCKLNTIIQQQHSVKLFSTKLHSTKKIKMSYFTSICQRPRFFLFTEDTNYFYYQGSQQQQDLSAASIRLLQPQQTRHLDRLLQQAPVCPGECLRWTQESSNPFSARKWYFCYTGSSFYRYDSHHPSVSRISYLNQRKNISKQDTARSSLTDQPPV